MAEFNDRKCLHPVILKDGRAFPCGHCPNCRMKYRKQFALRIYMEKCIERPAYSYFITLTYNDESIPYFSGRQCFSKDHITTFLDSLRHGLRRVGYSFRYFGSCEYGEEGYRPHYHFVFFLYPVDTGCEKCVFRRHEFNHLYCQKYWHYGFTYDGTVTVRSVLYVTCYALKDDESLERDWTGFEPGRPFRVFSLKPGLGLTDKCLSWWLEYAWNDGQVRSFISVQGSGQLSSGIPTGVKRRFSDISPYRHEAIKDANLGYFEDSMDVLLENASRYGSSRDYRLKNSVASVDYSVDERIVTLRKALRLFRKQERFGRKPL